MNFESPTHQKSHSSGPSGFTLVEMLLVLTILAILAGIVLPSMAKRGDDARQTAAKTDISHLATALSLFEVDIGHFPKKSDGLQALLVKPREDSDHWKGPYVDKNKLPLDPWQHPYVYEFPGKHNPASYDLYSNGKDGQSIIGNWNAN